MCLTSTGCLFSYQKLEYKRGLASLTHKEYDQGFVLLERVIKRDTSSELALLAARRGARAAVLEAKDYPRALFFNRQLVLNSPDESERLGAQKQIAQILFQSMANFEKAIVEYNKLLTLPHSTSEGYEYQLNVAKSYYQLNNFYQASVEADDLLSRKLGDDERFEVLLFKANLALTDKKMDAAIKAYRDLLTNYPEKAKKENVPLNLSVCYEERGDLHKAIEILNDLRTSYPTPEFIDLKINRLKERAANLPGAEGLKK